MKCKVCKAEAAVALASHNAAFCDRCYLEFFRRQVRKGIEQQNLFTESSRILVALSGGKDSLSLILELKELGYDVTGLFIDLKIPDSSDMARAITETFCRKHDIALQIVDLDKEGLAIPKVKSALKRPICSACGKIKRYYFNKCALEGNFDALATGHNLDDEVARLFSNVLRWDRDYLAGQGPLLPAGDGFAAKVKPLWRLTEFETANYAFIRQIPLHWAPCPYSAGASFSILKNNLNRLERQMPGKKIDFYQGFLARGRPAFKTESVEKKLAPCVECGMATSSGNLCGVCRIRKLVAEKNN